MLRLLITYCQISLQEESIDYTVPVRCESICFPTLLLILGIFFFRIAYLIGKTVTHFYLKNFITGIEEYFLLIDTYFFFELPA